MKCLDKLFGRHPQQSSSSATRPLHPQLRKEPSVTQLNPARIQQRRPLDRKLHGSRSFDKLNRMGRERRSSSAHAPFPQYTPIPTTISSKHCSLPPTPQIIQIHKPASSNTPSVRPRRASYSAAPAAVHVSTPASFLPQELSVPWASVADLHLTHRVFLSDCANALANAPHVRSATFDHVRADDTKVAPYEQLVLSQRFHMEFAARVHNLQVVRLLDVRCDVSRLLGALDAPALAHLEIRYNRAHAIDGEEVSEILRYVRSHDKMYRQRMGRFLQTVKIRGTRIEGALYVFSAELLAKGGSDSERLRGSRDQYGRKVAMGFDIA
ncbi:hypothetical protein EV121DRAFT_269830 [Schizophyllum commune]